MNCAEAAECVSALFDGEPISREMAAHLSDCEACRSRLNDYAELGAELRDMANAAAPQAIPEGQWKLAEPAAATNWLGKWRGTMRIPRFAFALMLGVIFVLSGGLALVKARTGGSGPVLWLTFRIPPKGGVMHMSATTDHEAELGSFVAGKLPGHMWTSVRFIKREGERVQLAIKTVYHEPGLREPNGCNADEALKNIPALEYWLEPETLINIPIEGLGSMEVSGEFVNHVPIAQDPKTTLDPAQGEFRVMSPVLIRDNQVLLNLTGMSALETVEDAVMLYSADTGRFIFSPLPIPGAVEGKLQSSEISFTAGGKGYLLLTGAPITQAQHVWVLLQPDWRPTSQPNPSARDHRMLAGDKLQSILDWK